MGISTWKQLILLAASSKVLALIPIFPPIHNPGHGGGGGAGEATVTISISYSFSFPPGSPWSVVTCAPDGPSGQHHRRDERAVLPGARANSPPASRYDEEASVDAHFNVRGAYDEDCEDDVLCLITQEVNSVPTLLSITKLTHAVDLGKTCELRPASRAGAATRLTSDRYS